MPIDIRPPQPPQRMVLVNAKIPAEVRDRIVADAEKKGHTLSSWLRALCEAQVKVKRGAR